MKVIRNTVLAAVVFRFAGNLYADDGVLKAAGAEPAGQARIFVALLAKRMGVAPAGWQDAAGAFADDRPRTVADIHDAESLAEVREWKRAAKAARRDKQDRLLA